MQKYGFWSRIFLPIFEKRSKKAKISKSAIICLKRLKTTFYLWPLFTSISIHTRKLVLKILSIQNMKIPAISKGYNHGNSFSLTSLDGSETES